MTRRKPFKLLSLLRIRKHAEQSARAKLGEAAKKERTAEEVLQQRYDELTSMNLDAASRPENFQAAVAARIAATQHVLDARVFLEAATENKQHASQEWLAAKANVAAIEKLQERHLDEQRHLEAVAEQHSLDEAGSRSPTQPPH